MENTIQRDEKGRILPNQPSLNPNGRPVGAYSVKTLLEKRLKAYPEAETQLLDDILKKEPGLVMQMFDGKPKASMDLQTSEKPVTVIFEELDVNEHKDTLPTS